MNLNYGKNTIRFIVYRGTDIKIASAECEIHLYNQYEKLIVSDVDGTLTKSDISGLACNLIGRHHIHNGYI